MSLQVVSYIFFYLFFIFLLILDKESIKSCKSQNRNENSHNSSSITPGPLLDERKSSVMNDYIDGIKIGLFFLSILLYNLKENNKEQSFLDKMWGKNLNDNKESDLIQKLEIKETDNCNEYKEIVLSAERDSNNGKDELEQLDPNEKKNQSDNEIFVDILIENHEKFSFFFLNFRIFFRISEIKLDTVDTSENENPPNIPQELDLTELHSTQDDSLIQAGIDLNKSEGE
jgi:hypothetical protein